MIQKKRDILRIYYKRLDYGGNNTTVFIFSVASWFWVVLEYLSHFMSHIVIKDIQTFFAATLTQWVPSSSSGLLRTISGMSRAKLRLPFPDSVQTSIDEAFLVANLSRNLARRFDSYIIKELESWLYVYPVLNPVSY